jgi:hypothetical protein
MSKESTQSHAALYDACLLSFKMCDFHPVNFTIRNSMTQVLPSALNIHLTKTALSGTKHWLTAYKTTWCINKTTSYFHHCQNFKHHY